MIEHNKFYDNKYDDNHDDDDDDYSDDEDDDDNGTSDVGGDGADCIPVYYAEELTRCHTDGTVQVQRQQRITTKNLQVPS